MERNGSNQGRATVVAYTMATGSIVIEFSDGWKYIYNHARPGALIVAEMQRLARSGQGLDSYIDRVVRDRFARRFL